MVPVYNTALTQVWRTRQFWIVWTSPKLFVLVVSGSIHEKLWEYDYKVYRLNRNYRYKTKEWCKKSLVLDTLLYFRNSPVSYTDPFIYFTYFLFFCSIPQHNCNFHSSSRFQFYCTRISSMFPSPKIRRLRYLHQLMIEMFFFKIMSIAISIQIYFILEQ